MTTYIALLRAVNVGGTGKLAMTDLKAIADALGYAHARTYIASGNLVLASDDDARSVKAALEDRLAAHAGKAIGVVIRTMDEMRQVLADDPFPAAPRSSVAAIFLDAPPPHDAITAARHRDDEEIALGAREIYVRYGAAGMGRSKLVLPAAKEGTARNLNTVAKLVELAAAIPS